VDRRKFLTGLATAGGLALLGGGIWGRQAYARGVLSDRLLQGADPVLADKARKELFGDPATNKPGLPAVGREAVRAYFHEICVKVPNFVEEIQTDEFANGLARCQTRQQQQEKLLWAFRTNVVKEGEVLDKVQTLAADLSRTLDTDWSACCGALADRWGVIVKDYRVPVTAEDLLAQTTPHIQAAVRDATEQARAGGERVVTPDLAADVRDAVRLLVPVKGKGLWAGWPEFVARVLDLVFGDCVEQKGSRARVLTATVSDRFATLGNRMGAEFENAVSAHVKRLHEWQEAAVATAAHNQAAAVIRLL
jgi:hypothetical protein